MEMERDDRFVSLLKAFDLHGNATLAEIRKAYLEKTSQVKFQRVILSDENLRNEFCRYHETYLRILKYFSELETPIRSDIYTSEQTSKFFFNQGVYDLCKENYLQAGEKLHNAYNLNKENIVLLIYLGVFLLKRKSFNAAEKFLLDALKMDQNNDDAWYYAGENYFKAGRYLKAIEYFETARTLNPSRQEVAFRIKESREGLLRKPGKGAQDTILKKIVNYVKDAFGDHKPS